MIMMKSIHQSINVIDEDSLLSRMIKIEINLPTTDKSPEIQSNTFAMSFSITRINSRFSS